MFLKGVILLSVVAFSSAVLSTCRIEGCQSYGGSKVSCTSKSCYFPGASNVTCLARAKDLTDYSQATVSLGVRNPHKEVNIVGPVCEFNTGIYTDKDFVDYCKYFKGEINPTDSVFDNPVCVTAPPPAPSTEGIKGPPVTVTGVTALPAQQPAVADQTGDSQNNLDQYVKNSQELLKHAGGKLPPVKRADRTVE